jgi:Sulfotransferase domain
MPEPEPPLPTFLIIGAQKSATRWLRVNLGQHPEVYAAPVEIMYFSNREWVRERGADWYRTLFTGWAGEPIVGESSPSYMAWQRHPDCVAERVKKLIPDVRLLAILRNPVDRAHSALVHHIKQGRFPANTDLVELVGRTPPEKDRWGLIAGGWYAASLKPFKHHFGDQLLVLLHDDLCDEPQSVYDHALRHIGATPGFVPPSLNEIVFSNQLAGAGSRFLPGRTGVSLAPRQRLFEFFRDDVRRLKAMIGRDLSMWDPDH